MARKAFYEMLGAPLHSYVWSWGAVRSKDDSIFLSVWKDEMQPSGGLQFVKILSDPRSTKSLNKPGRKEREEHIGRIRKGARCYLIICEKNPQYSHPNRIGPFNQKEVFIGGGLRQFEDKLCIEVCDAVPVDQLKV
jgi:hypothetical protein